MEKRSRALRRLCDSARKEIARALIHVDVGNGYGRNNVRIFHFYCAFSQFRSKPKTQRGKQFLEDRVPKLVENTKRTMFVKGTKTSDTVTRAMTDLVSGTLSRFYFLNVSF